MYISDFYATKKEGILKENYFKIKIKKDQDRKIPSKVRIFERPFNCRREFATILRVTEAEQRINKQVAVIRRRSID